MLRWLRENFRISRYPAALVIYYQALRGTVWYGVDGRLEGRREWIGYNRSIWIRLPRFLHKPILALLLALWVSGAGAHAKWFEMKADGPEPHKRDMLDQVLARSQKPQHYLTKYAADLITMSHECSHDVNNRITNEFGGVGWYGFYVGGGKAAVFREPKIRISDIAPRVQQRWRNYHQYFNVVGPQQDTMPLYILDEWVAAINGAMTGHERNAGDTGDRYMACEFSHYANALMQTVREIDPSYPEMADLAEFIEHEKDRTKLVESLPRQPQRAGMAATETFNVRTQNPQQLAQCQSCPGGVCYPSNNNWQPVRQPSRVIYKPIEPILPTTGDAVAKPVQPQPVSPQANEKIKQEWLAYITNTVNTSITNKLEGKECKCQGCVTKADLDAAIADCKPQAIDVDQLTIKITNALSQKFEQRFVHIEQKLNTNQPAPPVEPAAPQIFSYDIVPRK